ncbi:hypothetical protein DPMN_166066 [Dreissena polymorpha]|uniref:Uncharacterized protein n=1 Tax=Dreissena polymorpha TaxID=45954 RepID=A0A9D4IX17_DREPO|nr:hypothetical protein DPMN_166066 [Dreissena polymorpha]
MGEEIVVGCDTRLARCGTGAAGQRIYQRKRRTRRTWNSPELRGGGLMDVSRGGGTQHAQRTGKPSWGFGRRLMMTGVAIKAAQRAMCRKSIFAKIVSTPLAE